MASRTVLLRPPSLRRRFAVWFGLVFVFGAVVIRLLHYQATVAALTRDLDVQLWSRLGAVKAQERFAPDTLLGPHLRSDGMFLPDMPADSDAGDPHILGFVVPTLLSRFDAGPFGWFGGIWGREGGLIDDLGLPAGFAWDPGWRGRLDTIWTTADGSHRLAATAGAHDTVLVVGTPLAELAAAKSRAAVFQVWTFVLWVPFVLGVVWLLLSGVLVPLAEIAATARRIREGRFEERIDVARTDTEFSEMAGTINEMLDRLDAIRLSQSRFNADVAHQLMNPIHAILLESDAAATAPRVQEDLAAALGRVGELGRRIEAICEVLLAYSRSAALDPTRLQPVDLEPIIDAAIERTAARARNRGITIVPPSSGVVVKGDASLLEEVFVNLLVNAEEHSPAGGRIEIEADADSHGFRVAVVDHGGGVSAADLPKLFERFHSGKPSGGHGIGLALTRSILRSHGGDVVYTATPGGGATFTVRFPRPANIPPAAAE